MHYFNTFNIIILTFVSKIINMTTKEYLTLARELTKLNKPKTDLPLANNIMHFKSKDHYVIDHKIPTIVGYRLGIPLENICHIDNLHYITGFENNKKGKNIIIDDKNKWIYPYNIAKDENINPEIDKDKILTTLVSIRQTEIEKSIGLKPMTLSPYCRQLNRRKMPSEIKDQVKTRIQEIFKELFGDTFSPQESDKTKDAVETILALKQREIELCLHLKRDQLTTYTRKCKRRVLPDELAIQLLNIFKSIYQSI